MQTSLNTPLTSLQLELLRIYSFNPTTEDLQDVKTILAKYFAQKFTDQVNKAVSEKNITDSDLDEWLKDQIKNDLR
jgi:hypothetical protein